MILTCKEKGHQSHRKFLHQQNKLFSLIPTLILPAGPVNYNLITSVVAYLVSALDRNLRDQGTVIPIAPKSV